MKGMGEGEGWGWVRGPRPECGEWGQTREECGRPAAASSSCE